MRSGLWHQLGDRGQKIALEQLQSGNGVGVILSPRDLSKPKAVEYSSKYREAGSEVIFDPQLYVPHSRVGKQATYEELIDFRVSASRLAEHSPSEFKTLSKVLRKIGRQFSCTAIMAPAIAMQAGQPEDLRVNLSMLDSARDAADRLDIPVFATIPIGESLVLSETELSDVLSVFTSKSVDGWILMMDLGSDGLCRNPRHLAALCRSVLRLAQTGTNVMHGCAGPHCLLSLACGARGVGIAHSKNMWRLPLSRFEVAEGGGGGAAPIRVFSTALWSTFVFPDEFVRLPKKLRRRVFEPSDWLKINPGADEYIPAKYSQWDANKHLIHALGETVSELLELGTARRVLPRVKEIVHEAASLHDIVGQFYDPKDAAAEHHHAWLAVLNSVWMQQRADFDYLAMLDE